MKTFLYTLAAPVSEKFDVPRAGVDDTSLATILEIVFGIMGAIALIVLLLASLKYVISRGEPGEVAKAKNAIIYAVIGLMIIGSAFTIVSFVVNRV